MSCTKMSCTNMNDFGLLFLRVGLGVMFLFHGYPKLFGGMEKWTALGTMVGLNFFPAFWGFMAAISEFGGGLCLIFGIFVRPACLFMALTMCVASFYHFSQGHPLHGKDVAAAHAMENGIVFLAMIFLGAGSYSLDAKRCGATGNNTSGEGGTKSCGDSTEAKGACCEKDHH